MTAKAKTQIKRKLDRAARALEDALLIAQQQQGWGSARGYIFGEEGFGVEICIFEGEAPTTHDHTAAIRAEATGWEWEHESPT